MQETGAAELGGSAVSRRQFLRIAGVAGAAIGGGGGLGALLAACGSGTETATTAGVGETTATSAATSATTAAAGAEAGRAVKAGYVSPVTGPAALFGHVDEFVVARWKEAIGDGVVLGDGKKHPISITVADSQSDSMRAGQVGGDLMQNTKVDIIMAASAPDTVNPVADQAEALGVPCISTDCPVEPYYFGRGGTPDKPFKWTYHLFWGMPEIQAVSLDLWSQVPNNKVVGCVWPNNTDGNAYRDSYPAVMEKAGYKVVDGGLYQEPNEDFTSLISKFKNAGAEIFTGLMIPPDWSNFWKQCKQQGWTPKIVDLAKAVLFSSGMEALGEVGYGIAGPQYWHPTFPYKSSLTGETCQQLADEWEKRTGEMWQQPVLHYIVGEVMVDVLKRTTNVDDKEEIIKNIAATKMDTTIAGPIDFTSSVAAGSKHPVRNVYVTPLYGGQWVKGTKYPFDLKIVSNAAAPDVKVQGKLGSLVK